jgi:hypothetical protein
MRRCGGSVTGPSVAPTLATTSRREAATASRGAGDAAATRARQVAPATAPCGRLPRPLPIRPLVTNQKTLISVPAHAARLRRPTAHHRYHLRWRHRTRSGRCAVIGRRSRADTHHRYPASPAPAGR